MPLEPSRQSENGGFCEFLLYEVPCINCANGYTMDTHTMDSPLVEIEPDEGGRRELGLAWGRYVCGRIHVYPSVVTSSETSDILIGTGLPSVTVHVPKV